jgi:hypothetical protein
VGAALATPRRDAVSAVSVRGTRLALLGDGARKHARGRSGERNMDQSKMKIAYVVTQRGTNKYWTRIGAAFVNRDGSINVKLEAVPVNGEIHVRDYVPREDREESGSPTLLKKAGNGHSDESFAEPA